MRILCIASPKSGVAYHRLIMPLIYMMQNHKDDYLKITNHVTEEELEKRWDVLIVNRAFSLPAEMMERYKNKYGFKLIVDNDDYWHLDPHHVLYDHYIANDLPNKIEGYIQIADICTATHERLADAVWQINKNVYILPNALPYGEGQFADVKEPSDKVRLFWSGSDTHAQDICILRNPIKRIYSTFGSKVSTVMAGYSERSKPVWDVMISAFTHGLKFDSRIYQFSDPETYMFPYCDSDISLIPLLDTKFNAMKSNLKVLETAAKRNPAIVSEVNPYLNMPLCYARTQQYWHKWVHELVNDEAMRIEKGNELFEFCNKHFNLKEVNQKRYEIFSR
jgi:hypothetical protein